MQLSLGGAEEFPLRAQWRICRGGADDQAATRKTEPFPAFSQAAGKDVNRGMVNVGAVRY
jgi:hypothetical protein